MLVLTNQLGISSSFKSYTYGIGLWTDKQQNQSYFYCVTTEMYTLPPISSDIFRINISENLPCEWELVGTVDFLCNHAFISPCGKYFWSLETLPYEHIRSREQKQLIFRQIDIKSLKYEVFQVSDFDPNITGEIKYIQFYHTRHFGTILIVQRSIEPRFEYFEESDIIFHLNLNTDEKCVQLKQFKLPDMMTVDAYPFACGDFRLKRSSYGLLENEYSLFFYQIDYFGDVFVLEWSESEPLKWIQFVVEGDKFENWMRLENRDLSTHASRDNIQEWCYGSNHVNNNRRVHFPNGFIHCTHDFMDFKDDEQKSHFYQCKFQIETRICKCKRIFSTCRKFVGYFQTAITSKDPYSDAQLFFLNKDDCTRNTLCWEQVTVNRIPKLLHISYLVASLMIKRRGIATSELSNAKLREFQSVDTEEPTNSSGVNNHNQTVKRDSVVNRIVQRFKRAFTKNKKNGFPKLKDYGKSTMETTLNKVEHESSVCGDQRTIVLPTVNYLQITDLLNKLINKNI